MSVKKMSQGPVRGPLDVLAQALTYIKMTICSKFLAANKKGFIVLNMF